MITRFGMLIVFALTICPAVASAQERASLRPVFTAGQESRYSITATVETAVTPTGENGIAANVRRELTATIAVRTVKLADTGEIQQQATVEELSFSGGVASPAASLAKRIDYTVTPSGDLVKCAIPSSPAYVAAADLLFSLLRWYPAGEIAVGGSWEISGHGPMYTDRLSDLSKGATTAFKLSSVTKNIASIEGAITLNQNGTSVLAAAGVADVGVIASGKGAAHFDFDLSAGRLVSGVTESRLEGRVSNTRPSAAGEKLSTREGLLVETSRFSIKLIQ